MGITDERSERTRFLYSPGLNIAKVEVRDRFLGEGVGLGFGF